MCRVFTLPICVRCPRESVKQHNRCFVSEIHPLSCMLRFNSELISFLLWRIPNSFYLAKAICFWREWRLSRGIRSMASAHDYMFSSKTDVILKGFHPVAAYLWICITGLYVCTHYPTISPLQLFLSMHFSWWGSALFSSCRWTADPLAKVPLLIGLNVLFMAPVEHSKRLDREPKQNGSVSSGEPLSLL